MGWYMADIPQLSNFKFKGGFKGGAEPPPAVEFYRNPAHI